MRHTRTLPHDATRHMSGIKAQVQEWWNARPCGSRVSAQEIGSKAFFDEVERHRYAQEYHIPQVVNFAAWKGKTVLEIGCGLGTDLLQFARAGAHVTGIDLTPRSVELTSSRFALYGVQGRFCVADAENLSFAAEAFDLVYSHGVLHHTPNTRLAIDEIYRVLKPGGTAIVMLYHKHSYNYWINIRVFRRVAFALLKRGLPLELLSKVAGVPIEILYEYKQILKQKPQWTAQDHLNNNTDGPANPLSKVFTRAEAKAAFYRFSDVRTKVYWLVKKNIPLLGKLLPRPLDYLMGRLIGWDLYIIAIK